MNALIALLWVQSAAPIPQEHQASWCENIRAVRSLAVYEHLDDQTLAALELEHCGRPSTTAAPAIGRDCADLWTMAALGRAARLEPAALSAIDAEAVAVCRSGGAVGPFRWPSGGWAHAGDGWWYPNGRAARSGETWWYPSGAVAAYQARWWSPSGRLLKDQGQWRSDGGAPLPLEALLASVCPAHVELCESRVPQLQRLPDEARDAGMVELLSAVRP
jgi:hypothetical protein